MENCKYNQILFVSVLQHVPPELVRGGWAVRGAGGAGGGIVNHHVVVRGPQKHSQVGALNIILVI